MKYKICCPYCHKEPKLVKGVKMYPMRPDLAQKYFYLCEPCEAWVGCHPTSTVPLGRLANADLRRAKMLIHESFDRIWREEYKTRSQAYSWLAGELDIPVQDCHIGLFDIATCFRAIEICNNFHECNIKT